MKEYYLGLDVGTNSLGWAVTDSEYNLLRVKGKILFGVRFFKEGISAADRRVNRSNRRRTQRKNLRLDLLREIFEEELNKKDPLFLKRLDESRYWEEDKKVDSKNSLFNDENYKDKDYFKDFPTIFHLRNNLMGENRKKDIRLYFLAINQMMKRRGHFLIDGNLKDVNDVSGYKERIEYLLNEEFDLDGEDILEKEFFDKIFEVILNKKENKTTKKNQIKEITLSYISDKTKKKKMEEFWNLIISGKNSVKNLFDDENILKELEETNKEKVEIVFFTTDFEDNHEYFENLLGEKIEIIDTLKAIYDFVILQGVLNGAKTLSEAQVKRFNEHKKQLEELKKLVLKYNPSKEIYNRIFKEKNKDLHNYVSYIGVYKGKKEKETIKKISADDFYKFLKKQFKELCSDYESNEDFKEILNEIDKSNYLLKQIVSTNSTIPYQIHLIELEKILENLEKDFPYFTNISDGIKFSEKIKLIFTFRIPYYVGPLNNAKGENSWIVKKEGMKNKKIRPWNFSKIVDEHECEEAFIKRMINICTYLPNEKVLPKSSLLYSEYMVFNEFNNLKFNGEKLSAELKNEIIENVYKRYKKVTIKKIRDYLITNNYATKDIEITGYNGDLHANLASYIDFENIFGNNFDRDMVEDIIEQITIHVGNKKLLSKKIAEKYPNITEQQLEKIVNKKYTGWASFSKEFLSNLKGVSLETGEQNTIIGFLKSQNDNLMQLLSQNYTFMEDIDKLNKESRSDKLSYDVIKELYVSPAVKKMIWQVLKFITEIKKIMGGEPKKLFIEMARADEEKNKQTNSRKKELENLYNGLSKDDKTYWNNQIKEKEEYYFRRNAVYLYYKQLGKCMYSGDPIDLEDILSGKGDFDIDHIIPRHLKTDNSVQNNLVLVKRNLNQTTKKEQYPIPSIIRNNEKVKKLWEFLRSKNFISATKYDRLVRKEELTDEELGGFIARQLVETRQSTKVIKDLVSMYFENTTVIPVKADLANSLRKDLSFAKCRELNDFHHAHDAYLNIVAGDVWNKKFTINPINFIKEINKEGNRNRKYSLYEFFKEKQFSKNRGEKNKIWDPDIAKKKINKVLNTYTLLFTNDTYEQRGEISDVNIVGKKQIKKGTKYLAIKKDDRLKDVSKYGGYNKIKGTYFFLVEHKEKGKLIRTIESLPLHKKVEIKNIADLQNFAENELKLIEPTIIISKIPTKTELEINGFRYLLNGKTDNRLSIQPFMQMFWDTTEMYEIGKLFKKYSYNTKTKKAEDENGENKEKEIFDSSDKENIKKYLKILIERLHKEPFKNRINIPELNINEEMDSIKMFELFKEILNLSRRTLESVNLTSIGGEKTQGKTRINKKLNHNDSIKIILKSLTGVYEKKVDLNKCLGEQL